IGGVDDEIAAPERRLAGHRLLEAQITTHFVRVARREFRHCLKAFRVDVHEDDFAPRQPRRQAEILHQPEREDRTARPNHPNPYRLAHDALLSGNQPRRHEEHEEDTRREVTKSGIGTYVAGGRDRSSFSSRLLPSFALFVPSWYTFSDFNALERQFVRP